MKYIKILVAICAFLVLLPQVSKTQDAPKIDINAVVVGSDNEPLIGAVVKNNAITTLTDEKGSFTLQAVQNSLIIISATGYKDKEIMADANLSLIVLEPSIEVVQLFYRKANKKDILGGVSVVSIQDEFNKNYTTYAFDGLNTLTGGFNGNSIWGRGDLLVVIDGIPSGADAVKAAEIDQITILKGAGAVALYGTNAVNGVLYITTKRGQVSEQKIDVRVNSGMHVPKRYPDYLKASDYMTLYTEAYLNDGLDITTNRLPFEVRDQYTNEIITTNQEMIDNYASGINPYRYPDVDFYSSEFLKSAYNRSDVNADIYGGSENIRYYTNVGFSRQGSLLNFGEGKKSFDKRFNIRGNIDIKINKWLNANVDAGVIFTSTRGTLANYWQQASELRPTMGSESYHPLIPISMINLTNAENKILLDNATKVDDKYILGGTLQNQTNPFAEIYLGGYNKNVNRMFMFNTGLDMDLSGIAKGLAFRTKIAVDYVTGYTEGYDHQYRVYYSQWSDSLQLIDTLRTNDIVDKKSNVLFINNSSFQRILFLSGQLDYKRTINDNHNILAMLIATGYQYATSGSYQKINNTNLATHFGYNFRNKYYMEFNGSFMYTTKLPTDNRLNFSPVFSLGWRISEENFMKDDPIIDNLKLTATIGRLYTDNEIGSNYLYSAKYLYRGVGFFTWSGVTSGRDVATSMRGGNPDLKSPYRDEISFGFETSLLKNLLEIEANYFSIKYMRGVVLPTDLYPSYMYLPYNDSYERSFIPYINYDERMRTGYDFNVRLNKQLGQVKWMFGIAGTYYDTEILKDARKPVDDYQLREGTPIDGIWGLQSAGFYYDQDDIDNSPATTFGTVKPGDIKYIDQNGDDKISVEDEVLLAKGGWYGSPYTIGVNLAANWKAFTFYVQGVGQWGAYGMKNRTTDWVYGQRKYSDVVVNRWAYIVDPVSQDVLVDTRATATYPRLTTQESQNNFRNSDFWLYKTDRFDITKVQISYNLPGSIIKNTFIKNVDIYISASNLLTISPEKKYLETNVGSAPQTRFYNMGITASF